MARGMIPTLSREFIINGLSEGRRSDGRGFDDWRELSVESGFISAAEGSARVRLGTTDVVAGVKCAIGEPFTDKPEMGVLSTSFEMGAIAAPDFDSGPPSEAAVEIARVTDRAVREGRCLELDKLCIEPGKRVWVVNLDITIMNFDGNILDAAEIAATAALRSTMVPASRFGLGEDFKLPLGHVPISVTGYKIGGHVVLDPTWEEEYVSEARLTVSTDEHGDIRAMQKGGLGSFSIEEVKKIIKRSQDMGSQIRNKIA